MESFAVMTEFAVELAGFSGVSIAIANRDGQTEELTRFRNRNLLISSFGAAFGSASVPLADSFGLAGTDLWRVVSVAVLVACVTTLLSPILGARRLASGDRRQLSPVVWYLSAVGSPTAAVAQIVNIGGFAWPPFAGPVFAGVFWMTFLSACQFFLIFAGPKRPSAA